MPINAYQYYKLAIKTAINYVESYQIKLINQYSQHHSKYRENMMG